ncbi:hypothetical protein PKHYL_14890 [Psychrobacter sp. KH172YL61]|nr:hypothetical protein PKHYL_14890 [Psychrobacter sp. KH172YL61]
MSDNRNAMPHSNTSNATDPLAAKKNITVAYTDGACKGNPGAGGWGAHLIFSDGSTQDLYGGDTETTNNRMELMGAIQALTHSSHEQKLEIWTDSSYVQKGITEWIEGWKKKAGKQRAKSPSPIKTFGNNWISYVNSVMLIGTGLRVTLDMPVMKKQTNWQT